MILMAVRVGFEPTVRRTYAGFQDQCFRPLSHLTLIALANIYLLSIYFKRKKIKIYKIFI